MEQLIISLSFSIFLVVFLGIGALAARRAENSESDYLLAGRSFGRVFVGLSAGATGNSGFIMVGMVGMAYAMGASALILVFATMVGEFLFWTFLAGRVNSFSQEKKAQTVPEMLGASVSAASGKRLITSMVALISIMLVGAYSAAQFSAAGKTLNVFFGLDPMLGAIVAAAAILSYCVVGGLRASVWTDVVQAMVVVAVTFGMTFALFYQAGGISPVLATLEGIDPNLVDPFAGYTLTTFLLFVLGFAALGFGFDLSQPQVLVRLLAGKNPNEVRTARWVYLGYVYSTWTVMTIFGIAARAVLPEIADPEQALPMYAMQNLDPWLVGIVLAGVFSVIASTADSQILVCSSSLVRDVSKTMHDRLESKFGIHAQQGATFLFGVFAVLVAVLFSSSVFTLVMFAVGALAGSLGPAMIVTLLRLRTNAIALGVTMLTGLSAAIVWRITGLNSVMNESATGLLIGLAAHFLIMRLVYPASITEVVAKDLGVATPPSDFKQAANY